jgi:hypothetical protein
MRAVQPEDIYYDTHTIEISCHYWYTATPLAILSYVDIIIIIHVVILLLIIYYYAIHFIAISFHYDTPLRHLLSLLLAAIIYFSY